MTSSDVIIHDTGGWPSDLTKPLGGAETSLHLLGAAMRKRGLSVEFTHDDRVDRRCKALIVSRYSRTPQRTRADRAVCYAADAPDARYAEHDHLPAVCISRYLARQFPPQWETRVIYPILGEHVYACAARPRRPVKGRWIYASSVQKGLVETLEAWRRGPVGSELVVTTTGYDEPADGMCELYGARWLGRLSPLEMPAVMAECEGLFYVNVKPEAFGSTTAIARVLGLYMRLGCEGHDACGLAEAQEDLDQREEVIAAHWAEFLFPAPRRTIDVPVRTSTIALAIPHTPWVPARAESMQRVREALRLPPAPAASMEQAALRTRPTAYREFSERAPNHVWSEQMWRWGRETRADWFLTLQDDTEYPSCFWDALAAQLTVLDEIGGDVLGLASPDPKTIELEKHGYRWYRSCANIVGWAYAVRRSALQRFLTWRAANPAIAARVTEDWLLQIWARESAVHVWHPIPTIVDHNTKLESEYGNDDHTLRRPFVLWYDYDLEALKDPAFWRPTRPIPLLRVPRQRHCAMCLTQPVFVTGPTGIGVCLPCLEGAAAVIVRDVASMA